MKRRILFGCLVILLPAVLFVAGGETVARLLTRSALLPDPPPRATIDPYKPNPYIWQFRPYLYGHIPGSEYIQARSGYRVHYSINSLGFRGPELSARRSSSRKRLVVLGDSVAEGQGCDFTETFPALLDRRLRDRGWQVVNAGVQGASPIYYACNLDRYLAMEPDAVLILLYENDLQEDRSRERSYCQLPILDNPGALLPGRQLDEIACHSRLLAVLRRRFRLFCPTRLERTIRRNEARWAREKEPGALFTTPATAIPLSAMDAQWALSQAYLEYVCEGFARREVVVLLSTLSLQAFSPHSPYHPHIKRLDELIERWPKERGIPCCSLIPAFRQVYDQAPPSVYLIENDDHPTREAQALIARVLSSFILEHGPAASPASR